MTDFVTKDNTHDAVPVDKKLDELHRLIDGIGIAMLTTLDRDGRLNARPMATQDRSEKADVWFMTSGESQKVDEILASANVNVSYMNGSKEWISISGTATVDRDRDRIRSAYRPDWKAWFHDEGGERDGGPDDTRIVLIDVRAEHVTYFKVDAPRPVILFEIARAALTGGTPKLGAVRHLDGREATDLDA